MKHSTLTRIALLGALAAAPAVYLFAEDKPQTDNATQAAAAGKSLPPTFRDGLATDYVTDAVLRSAKNRRWERVGALEQVTSA